MEFTINLNFNDKGKAIGICWVDEKAKTLPELRDIRFKGLVLYGWEANLCLGFRSYED